MLSIYINIKWVGEMKIERKKNVIEFLVWRQSSLFHTLLGENKWEIKDSRWEMTFIEGL